jgi:glutamine amidotransferase
MLIGLLDYGVGNLGSMRSALKQINSDFIDLTNAEGISKVDCLIIPGVGSFNTGVRNISQNNMYDEIVNFAKSGKRLLGVCLGMHLLATYGDEGGGAKGLNLIEGKIKKLERSEHDRVPHVGWDLITNQISQEENFVYFAHSYYFDVQSSTDFAVTETYKWNDKRLPAVIQKDNIFGVQFHPEKSHNFGLTMLSTLLTTK